MAEFVFIKSFKGYEDKLLELDASVNAWVEKNSLAAHIVDIKTCLSHEPGARAGSGDLIYTIVYRSAQAIP